MLKFKNFLDFKDYALDLLKDKDYEKLSSSGHILDENVRSYKRYIILSKNESMACVCYKTNNGTIFYDNDINVPTYVSLSPYKKDLYYYISNIYYMVKNRYHRPFYPAILGFSGERLISEKYYLNGKAHNNIGPAIRSFDAYSKRWVNSFYLNGIFVSKDTFFLRTGNK